MEIIVERKESQSSFEFGTTKNKHKVYYWTAEELKSELLALQKVVVGDEALTAFIRGQQEK